MLPKILYDTYVLGLAHTHPEVRTGVFRVVKNVIERLNQSNEVEVTFNINHNCKLDALEYIQQEASLGDRKNIYPSILQMYLSRSEREIALKQKKAKSNRHHSLMHRGVYGSIGKLLGYYSKLLK